MLLYQSVDLTVKQSQFLTCREWMDGSMVGVDPDVIDAEVGNYWRSLYKLQKGFDNVPAAKKICQKVSYVPLVHTAFF